MSSKLKEALDFFHLEKNFSLPDLQSRYRELAKKYHPDKGEFTSEVLFIQLLEYKQILEKYLLENENKPIGFENKKESDYEIYKKAKQIENDAILNYFNSRKNIPSVELDLEKNPELKILIEELKKAKALYEELIKKFPNSIWTRDAKDSIESMKVWWKS